MKHTGIKRIFSAVLVVVLAVGLMPLPAFAETASGQQEETPLVAVGSTDLISNSQMTTQVLPIREKAITGLGTGAISNPKFANGGWNKVYFGSGDTPLLFNVLNTHETCFGGDTMFLDCSTIVENRAPGTYGNEYFKSSLHKYLNGEFLEQRFTGPEQDAMAVSAKGSEAPGDGMGWVDKGDNGRAWLSPFCRVDARDKARLFILDAHEATNESYGFTNPGKTTNFYSDSFTRKKTGTTTAWWTRSKYEGIGYEYVTILSTGQFSYQKYTGPAKGAIGVSPCLNVKLSSILYTSLVDTNTYKLTVKDNSIKVNVGDAMKDLPYVTVPYTVTGDYDRLSILLTDAEWTDSGWSNTGSEPIYIAANESISSYTENSTTGTCSFKSEVLDDHPGYNVYLIAELQNDEHETDYASAPVKLTVKQGIYRIASGYTGTYDGKAHGITVDVTNPGSGATVKYGTAKGAYGLDASPAITNVADGPLTVYYQITADGYFTTTGSETVTILKANPEIPTGVTANSFEELKNVPLPNGWTWDTSTINVGNLGTKTFYASYESTDPNINSMKGVAIPVTVVESEHNWGPPSYEWSSDNKSVTAEHGCYVCGIDEMETVSTSSEISKQPTCSAKGKTTYTAEFENEAFAKQTKEDVEDIPIDHNAHNWGDWVQKTPPTCEGTGIEERVCTLDKTHIESRMTDVLGHQWKEFAWTIEDDPYMHWKRECERDGCNTVVEWDVEKGAEHIHTPVIVEAKAATCEEPGRIEHTFCTTCEHRFTSLSCKEELTDNQVRIAPLGHNLGAWTQVTEPTCSAAGESERTCSRDGCTYKETRTDAINPYAHAWGEWTQTTAPTCTKPGEDTRICTHDPSHTEKRVGAAALGHDWDEPVYTWAGDDSSVTATHTCKIDGTCEIETAAVTSKVTQKPTCSSKGKTTYTATFSKDGFTAQSKSFENVDIDPEAHEWSGWVAIASPTCTQTGTEERVCTHDPSHKESREIAVDPNAHSWGAWTTIKAATETEEGMEQRVCENDASHTETRAIPKLDPTKPDNPTKKANPLKVKAKKTIEAKAAKTTKIKKAITIKGAQGKVTVKTSNKKVKVAVKKNMKNGKTYKLNISVKKGLKKGKTYKVKVSIKAAGNAKYKPATIKKTIKVKVK